MMRTRDEEDVEAQRHRGRSGSTSKHRASQDTAEPSQPSGKLRWSKPTARLPVNLDWKRPSRIGKQALELEAGSDTPSQWPPERILFLLGIIFFPLWIFGAFWRRRDGFDPFADLHKWRCQVMLMMLSIIATGLMVVEVVFRET